MPAISQLPIATAVNPADLFVIVQAGTTKQATDSLVIAMIQSGIIISQTQVTGLTAALAARLVAANNLSDVANPVTALSNLGLPKLTANGQLYIGNGGFSPVAATLTAGSGISIANAAGAITISGTASSLGWTDVTGTTQTMVQDNGYVADNSGLVTFTLPATASFGTQLVVLGKGAGGWSIAQNVGQQIQIGTSSTTSGTGGSVSSTHASDSINLLCITANTLWTVIGAPQSSGLTIV